MFLNAENERQAIVHCSMGRENKIAFLRKQGWWVLHDANFTLLSISFGTNVTCVWSNYCMFQYSTIKIDILWNIRAMPAEIEVSSVFKQWHGVDIWEFTTIPFSMLRIRGFLWNLMATYWPNKPFHIVCFRLSLWNNQIILSQWASLGVVAFLRGVPFVRIAQRIVVQSCGNVPKHFGVWEVGLCLYDCLCAVSGGSFLPWCLFLLQGTNPWVHLSLCRRRFSRSLILGQKYTFQQPSHGLSQNRHWCSPQLHQVPSTDCKGS